jgi:hypothetical protein
VRASAEFVADKATEATEITEEMPEAIIASCKSPFKKSVNMSQI